jgi:hypothetical protein
MRNLQRLSHLMAIQRLSTSNDIRRGISLVLNRSFILRLWLLMLQVRAGSNDVREIIMSYVCVRIERSSYSILVLCGNELVCSVL